MKEKILKISVILVMILTMTMTNFIFVGKSLISYAETGIATNHKNIEFKAYFKSEEGKEITTLEKLLNEEETFLYLQVEVKKEGYFNGEIALENSNFTLKESDSIYVNKIENNTIYLNQINVGMKEEIKVRIEPIKEETYAIGLLDMTSSISVKGIYRDSTQKDIKIQANRDLKLKLIENNVSSNIQNEMKVITNKIIQIDGEEKRVLQFSYNMGLKENNYPIKEIHSQITIPEINGKQATVEKMEYLNNMTSFDYQYKENIVELTLKNEENSEQKVMWKAQGNENVILTCLYDKEAEIENMSIHIDEKVTLYNDKEIETENEITVQKEELDATIEVQVENPEEMIYKGKLKAGIDRQYETITQMKINYAKALPRIELTEESSQYIINGEQEEANSTYDKTTIKKEQFDKLFGENGKIIIYDQNNEEVDTITNETATDEEGNIVIYDKEKNVTKLRIQTTAPEREGILEFKHVKTIRASQDIEKIKDASELKNRIIANGKEVETTIQLENSETKLTLEVNKESLSTVVRNNVEIKTILTSNHEKYDLYKNPEITIELPEQVENVEIDSIDILYENELKIKDYTIMNGRIIKISLEGEQTQYKDETIEGAILVINASIDVNRKSTTREEEIRVTYKNNETGTTSKAIKIIAPTDITAIYSIQDLGIETLGQEENEAVLIQRGAEERQLEAQIEVINNNENAIENTRILGDFPTNHKDNNMGIEILKEITLQGTENASIYYTENEEATDDIENAENGWTEEITDASKVSKYLIAVDELEMGSTIQGQYTYQIPADLEYNQVAKTAYQVTYANRTTKAENELDSTSIEMQTGIGPKVETKLTATIGGKEANAPVKNGEVICYKIEIVNNGTEDVSNIKVAGKVPEGTVMVRPEEDYEYSGASYYQELENGTYETTIENLKVGQVMYAEYEVRVKNGVPEGTTLSNIAEIKYGDVTKQSEEIKNITANGNLRVTVKRVTDREVDLYAMGIVKYFAIIENISNQNQDNIRIQTKIPETLQVDTVNLLTGSTQVNRLEYEEELNIGALNVGESKILAYNMLINNVDGPINFSVVVTKGNEEYRSNNWQDHVEGIDIGIFMTATTSTQNQNVKAGDMIEYAITLENRSASETRGLQIIDEIPNQLTIEQITQDGKSIEGIQGNNINLPIRMEGKETTTVKITAVVDESEARNRAEAITNIAYAEISGKKIANTSEINHIIGASENSDIGDLEEDEDKNQNNGNDLDNNDMAKGSSVISGMAWYDENANGQRDQGEKLLSNIKVKLLNTRNQ